MENTQNQTQTNELLSKRKYSRKKKSFVFEYIMISIMALLIIVSGFQTYYVVALKKDLKKGAGQSIISSDSSLPASLQDLPDMVGGC